MGMRYYHERDGYYPSVTSVTSLKPQPWLQAWKNRTPDWGQVVSKAAFIGTLFHYRVGVYWANQNGLPPPSLELDKKKEIDDEVTAALSKNWEMFMKFVEQFPFNPSIIEEKIVNHEYQYAGRVDAIGLMDGELWVVDIKTGKSIYDEFRAQLAAYAMAPIAGFANYKGTKHIAVARFNYQTGWEFKEQDLEKGWEEFIYYLNEYKEILLDCKKDKQCHACKNKKCKLCPCEVVE